MYEHWIAWRVTVPEDCMGDVVGELNRRNGTITSLYNDNDGMTVEADAPFETMVDFELWVKQITTGLGTVIMVKAL